MEGRKNAMLTTEDRRWLLGEKTYSGKHAKQQRYQRRRGIRERVYNSILDFSVLYENLSDSESEKVFDPDNDPQHFNNGLRDAFAYLLTNTGIAKKLQEDATGTVLAEDLLKEAVTQIGANTDIHVTDVNLDIQVVESPDSLIEKLVHGEELSGRELQVILESDLIDRTAIQSSLREQVIANDDT